jgi:hypothetical protein
VYLQLQKSRLDAARLAVHQRAAQEEAQAAERQHKRNAAQDKKLGKEESAAE